MGRLSMYPEEFRREACELARRGDRSIRQVAVGLGIPDQTLCNWLKAKDKTRARGQDPESLSESALAELKRLRKENAELKMDREILLKASGFFSPRRRTTEPLPLRLRSPRPIPGQSTVPGGEGLTQRLLRLGQPSSIVPCVDDAYLADTIRDIYRRSRCTYGAPRVHGQLRRAGTRVGRKRVARLMAELDLVGVHSRKKWRLGLRELAVRFPRSDLPPITQQL